MMAVHDPPDHLSVELPPAYVEGMRRHLRDRAEPWLAALPGHIAAAMERWGLTAESDDPGALLHGVCGVVLPVRRADDSPAMLKVTFVDEYTRGEAAALRAWDGRGAVRLHAADMALDQSPDAGVGALLLERLDHWRTLAGAPEDEAARVVGGLIGRFAACGPPDAGDPATAELLRQETVVDEWLSRLPADYARLGAPFPADWLAEALDTCRDLGRDHPGTVADIDLHHANVLAGEREPWLAIDPMGMVGDPAFCLEPFVRNRWERVADAADPRTTLRHRFAVLVESAGLDPARCRAWTRARAVETLLFALEAGDAEVETVAATRAVLEWLV